jgi:hypothetical protein
MSKDLRDWERYADIPVIRKEQPLSLPVTSGFLMSYLIQ